MEGCLNFGSSIMFRNAVDRILIPLYNVHTSALYQCLRGSHAVSCMLENRDRSTGGVGVSTPQLGFKPDWGVLGWKIS